MFQPSDHSEARVNRRTSLNNNTLINAFFATLTVSLGLETIKLMIESADEASSIRQSGEASRYTLDNDPQCGVSSRGRAECDWDCEAKLATAESGAMFKHPECLDDCFPPDHCITKFIEDFKRAGGVCQGSPGTWFCNPECNFYKPSTNTACTIENPLSEDPPFMGAPSAIIVEGICSDDTEEALTTEQCVFDTFEKSPVIYNTIWRLIRNTCRQTVFDFWTNNTKPPSYLVKKNPTSKLTPLFGIAELDDGQIVRTKPEFENTKHRYPWICSLRSKDINKTHQCGVTLLRRPPGPTVLVTAAHCTFLCKSNKTETVANCCCDNVGDKTCSNNEECGENNEVLEMTGEDVEVVCGEWETGAETLEESGEEYNIVFNVVNITRHPDFNISRGANMTQYVINDIATIHLDEEVGQEEFIKNNINPACLPIKQNKKRRKNKKGKIKGRGKHRQTQDDYIHSGWSSPPPLSYLEQYAPLQIPHYRDFQKQWHHKMEVTSCEDPKENEFDGRPYHSPSNTYYPPGLVCAKEYTRYFCPTSGESGSTLMNYQGQRFLAEGIMSFIKGCGAFSFSKQLNFFPYSILPNSTTILYQQSHNPLVYTKISCFLAWVAQQYDLDYVPSEEEDAACSSGTGDITDVAQSNTRQCRTNPANEFQTFPVSQEINEKFSEIPCIFPYYLDGVLINDTCIQLDLLGLNYPVFTCPIWNITTKYPGTDINSYTIGDLTSLLEQGNTVDGYCPDFNQMKPDDLYAPLNPNEEECPSFTNLRTKPFSQCKNNCRGGDEKLSFKLFRFSFSVNFPVVSGGAALIYTGALAATSIIAPVVAGGGGAVVAGGGGAAVVGGGAAAAAGGLPFAPVLAGSLGFLGIGDIRLIEPEFIIHVNITRCWRQHGGSVHVSWSSLL